MSDRFVYFGTPYVARDTLALLHARGLVPELVVSSPDAPKGRGMELLPSETTLWARAHGLPVITPEKLTSDVIEEIAKTGAELAIVVAYGKILPQALIERFPLGVINIHYSLLPKYRGASPVEAALLAGDTITGVSIQRMVYELDAGDVIASKGTAIEPEETTQELRARLITLGAELLVDVLPGYLGGDIEPVPQDASAATFCGRIDKSAGELSILGDAHKNWNTYRAYFESPGTYFFATRDGKRIRVKLKSATFTNDTFLPLRVTPEGKKEMDYQDFLRGGYQPL